MGTIHKGDLGKEIASRLKGSNAQGDEALNAVIEAIEEAVAKGDTVNITGFGKFGKRSVKARTAPARFGSSQRKTVPAHKRVYFKPGAVLRKEADAEWYAQAMNRAKNFVSGVIRDSSN
ncbi:MAG: HU family DNA-binding protein [Chloroflexi bacterium]|nr:HU family DNA-binding protein [Chloroflexota bacterium]